jgi:16S rRNA (guanine527-N7)-methyltransferase
MLKSPRMDPDQIAALLEPFSSTRLTSAQLKHISTYIDILLKWNRRVNLTAIRDPDQVVARHFGESLFAAEQLFSGTRAEPAMGALPSDCSLIRLVDVGSGAGFPGLPIKIFAPGIKLTLIESHNKKATFLREVIRTLGLGNAEVFAGRAEDFPPASSEVVTLRAVERFEEILRVAADLVAPGGRFALLIGQAQVARATAELPRFTWQDAVPIPLSTARILLIGTLANSGR